jgi:hypothetical protein
MEVTTAARALAGLERSAVAIGEMEIPRVVGRGDATRRAQALLTSASTGAQLLGVSEVGAEAADAARRATVLLDHVPMTTSGLRSTSADLRELVAQIRAAEPSLPSTDQVAVIEARSRMLGHLEGTAPQFDTEDWRALATALASGDEAVAAMPRQLEGLKPIETIANELADSAYQRDHGVDRYMHAFEVGSMTPEARVSNARELLNRPAASLAREDWGRLSALVESPQAREIAMPSQLSGLKDFRTIAREIAAGRYTADAGAQLYFDSWRLAAMDPEQILSEGWALLARRATDLSQADWRLLSAMLESPHGSRLGAPTSLSGLKDLRTITRELGAGAYQADSGAQRYLDVWRANAMTRDEVVSGATTLLQRPARELSNRQWGELGALLESTNGSAVNMPSQLDGLKDFHTLTREIAAGKYAADAGAQRYFDAWRVAAMPREQAVAEAAQLLAMRAQDLTNEQWGRLGAIVESAHGSAIGAPDTLPGLKPLRQITRELAAGKYKADSGAQRYLDSWAISRMPVADAVAEAGAILTKPASELSRSEWLRLGSLMASRHADSIGVPRTLSGLKDFQTITREIGTGAYEADAGAQRYLTEWARRYDPAYQEQLQRALDAVVAGGADESQRMLVAGEWDRLEALVAGRPPADQAAIAAAMLQSDGVAASRSVQSTLALMQQSLRTTPAPSPELEPVRAQTLELVERNLARLSGHTPAGAVRGYSNHPDYGEVGRIRANMTLLEHARVTSSPAEATAEGAQLASESAAGSASGETLTW